MLGHGNLFSMKKAILFLFLLILLFQSCSRGKSTYVEKPKAEARLEMAVTEYDIDELEAPSTLSERFSYAYGNLLAQSLDSAKQDVNAIYFARGFLDYYGTSYFSESELSEIFIEYQNRMLEEAAEAYRRQSEENLMRAESFLELNAQRSGVITSESGLEYEILRRAEGGRSPGKDDTVSFYYTMTLLNGQIVESSYDSGVPSVVSIDALIEGVQEALQLMKTGERFRFWIHPSRGYGESGMSVIGPNELLIFEVELVDIL